MKGRVGRGARQATGGPRRLHQGQGTQPPVHTTVGEDAGDNEGLASVARTLTLLSLALALAALLAAQQPHVVLVNGLFLHAKTGGHMHLGE